MINPGGFYNLYYLFSNLYNIRASAVDSPSRAVTSQPARAGNPCGTWAYLLSAASFRI